MIKVYYKVEKLPDDSLSVVYETNDKNTVAWAATSQRRASQTILDHFLGYTVDGRIVEKFQARWMSPDSWLVITPGEIGRWFRELGQ